MAMNVVPRAVLGTIRNIPKAVTERASDADIAILCVELGRVHKELYAELESRRHRRWTACMTRERRR
jgi:hypothetical protein